MRMPRGIAAPTGRPLVFERTISFTPFAADGSTRYRDTCMPDPPAFGNPFAQDGKSPQLQAEPKPAETAEPGRRKIASSSCRRIRSKQRALETGA